jgi:flagellar assembly protein FliH
LALAQEILGREVRAFDDVAIGSAMKAMSLTPDRGPCMLRVHPQDRAAVVSYVSAADQRQDVEVVADPGVERGGCLAVAGPLLVDAQITSAIARIAEALGQ